MRVCSLASSSKGNCTIVYNDSQILLIDMGITLKELEEKLDKLSLSCNDIVGAIVSHEHSDHVKGLGSLHKRYDVPVFCHVNSLKGVAKKSGLTEASLIRFSTPFNIGDFKIDFFEVSHDVFCVGYNVYENENKISIVTDLGYTTRNIIERLYDSRLVILEANHDEKMVAASTKYPAILKARILGNKGHLSNVASAKVVVDLAQHNVRQILFGHLSEENNTLELCYSTICNHLESVGIKPQVNIKLDIAKPCGIGPVFVIK